MTCTKLDAISRRINKFILPQKREKGKKRETIKVFISFFLKNNKLCHVVAVFIHSFFVFFKLFVCSLYSLSYRIKIYM